MFHFRVNFIALHFPRYTSLCCIVLCCTFCFILYKINACYINWMCIILLFIVLTLSLLNFLFDHFLNYFWFTQTISFYGVSLFVLYFSCCIFCVVQKCCMHVAFSCFSCCMKLSLFNFLFSRFFENCCFCYPYICAPLSRFSPFLPDFFKIFLNYLNPLVFLVV